MILSRYNLKNINTGKVIVPDDSLFDLPETVLQFSTGGLPGGLPGYFIDKANRQGYFNGRIVVVKGNNEDYFAFERQDGLYTHCIRGIHGQEAVEQNIINASISRLLNADSEWQQVLECAHNLQLKMIISDTTEAGIQLVNEDIRKHPPASLPGKMLAVLYERFKAFDGSGQSGLIIVPTELIDNNGIKLESIIFELAHLNGLDEAFIEWLETSNHFCNSFVDCIVPGAPTEAARRKLENEFGYQDNLMVITEAYRLWAIEADAQVQSVLDFGKTENSIAVIEDISVCQDLKVRLLDGTHSLSCAVACLGRFATVKDAMNNKLVAYFISRLVKEISRSMPVQADEGLIAEFSAKVLDRLRNTLIEHHWLDIALQYSSKMQMRNIPTLLNYYETHHSAPRFISFGFAAYILFMRSVRQQGSSFFGSLNGKEYLINDDKAPVFARYWKKLNIPDVVAAVLRDTRLWEHNLSTLAGFSDLVTTYLLQIVGVGIEAALLNLKSEDIMEEAVSVSPDNV